MERFIEKDIEVVYMTDSADEYYIDRLQEYDGKKFQIISKEQIDLGDLSCTIFAIGRNVQQIRPLVW